MYLTQAEFCKIEEKRGVEGGEGGEGGRKRVFQISFAKRGSPFGQRFFFFYSSSSYFILIPFSSFLSPLRSHCYSFLLGFVRREKVKTVAEGGEGGTFYYVHPQLLKDEATDNKKKERKRGKKGKGNGADGMDVDAEGEVVKKEKGEKGERGEKGEKVKKEKGEVGKERRKFMGWGEDGGAGAEWGLVVLKGMKVEVEAPKHQWGRGGGEGGAGGRFFFWNSFVRFRWRTKTGGGTGATAGGPGGEVAPVQGGGGGAMGGGGGGNGGGADKRIVGPSPDLRTADDIISGLFLLFPYFLFLFFLQSLFL